MLIPEKVMAGWTASGMAPQRAAGSSTLTP